MKIYVVGGAVRNALMGLPINDMDYAVVGSTPEEMLRLGFSQVGADFPVFLHPVTGDEYALARTERKNGTGYHGFAVDASDSVTLADDLMRRDLTINAMAVADTDWQRFVDHLTTAGWDGIEQYLVDPCGGLADIRSNTIKPMLLNTFVEDPLRVVRAARFAATYGFTWSANMFAAAAYVVNSGELDNISPERFGIEIEKALKGCKTAGDCALFGHYMDLLGLIDIGPMVLQRSIDGRQSMAAKLFQLFHFSVIEGELDNLVTRFRLSNLIQSQIRMAVEVEDRSYMINHCKNMLGGVEASATNLYCLTEMVRKAPKGAGLEFVTEFAADYPTAAEVLTRVRLMSALFDTVRYDTHLADRDIAPSLINRELKRLRVAEACKLLC